MNMLVIILESNISFVIILDVFSMFLLLLSFISIRKISENNDGSNVKVIIKNLGINIAVIEDGELYVAIMSYIIL